MHLLLASSCAKSSFGSLCICSGIDVREKMEMLYIEVSLFDYMKG